MYARKVVPFLLMAGAVMMIMQHKRHEFLEQCEEGEPHDPLGLHHGWHGDLHHGWQRGPRGEWGKRVPPFFEMWHKRAHEQEQAAQQPAAPAPVV